MIWVCIIFIPAAFVFGMAAGVWLASNEDKFLHPDDWGAEK